MEYKWVVMTVTFVGVFMAGLDSSVVIIGLPTVLQDLNTTFVHGVWIITGYRLMTTVLLVSLGRIADMFGRVRLYNFGFAIFTVGSLLCGLSQTGEQLVLFRFLQGLGAALLIVNSAALVTDHFPRRDLGVGLGINLMAANSASIAGYTLSGVMMGLFGWRSIFLINVPIGVFGTLWAYKRLKEASRRDVGRRFDYAGSSLYCLGLSALLYALTVGNPVSQLNLTILTVGAMFFLIFILVERRQMQPTLDLSLFKSTLFTAGNLSGFLNSLSFSSAPFLLSLYFQMVKSYDPFEAGVLLIPMQVVTFFLAPISGKLSDKYGSRGISSIGLALNVIALLWFSSNQDAPYGLILIGLILLGVGRGLFTSPNSSSIMGSIPPERRGIANGVRVTLNNTGNTLSIPLSLLFMTFAMPYDKLSTLMGNTQPIGSGELAMLTTALRYAFLFFGVITAIAIIPSLLRGPPTHKDRNFRQGTPRISPGDHN
ncbi:MAG: MFS transporter [Thaumarchaeota archaeon]|nr:MFS transporter [Nitrososphaerota archaeon]